jgi:hypothetical protein
MACLLVRPEKGAWRASAALQMSGDGLRQYGGIWDVEACVMVCLGPGARLQIFVCITAGLWRGRRRAGCKVASGDSPVDRARAKPEFSCDAEPEYASCVAETSAGSQPGTSSSQQAAYPLRLA